MPPPVIKVIDVPTADVGAPLRITVPVSVAPNGRETTFRSFFHANTSTSHMMANTTVMASVNEARLARANSYTVEFRREVSKTNPASTTKTTTTTSTTRSNNNNNNTAGNNGKVSNGPPDDLMSHTVDLSRIALTSLSMCPNPLTSFARVTVLDVSRNELSTLDGVASMPALRVLDASRNKLTDLTPLFAAAPPALQVLDVRLNAITHLCTVPSQPMRRMRTLVLSCNHLTRLGDLARLFPELEELRVNRNRLTAAPDTPFPPRLRHLSLARNYLRPAARRRVRETQRALCALRFVDLREQRESPPDTNDTVVVPKPEKTHGTDVARRTKRYVRKREEQVSALRCLLVLASLRPFWRVANRPLWISLLSAHAKPRRVGKALSRIASLNGNAKPQKVRDGEEGPRLSCVAPRLYTSCSSALEQRAWIVAEWETPLRWRDVPHRRLARSCGWMGKGRQERIDRRRKGQGETIM